MTRGFQQGWLQSSPWVTMSQCHSVLKGAWGHWILASLCLYSPASWWGLQLLPRLTFDEIPHSFGSRDAHVPFICILSLGPHTCRYNNNTYWTFVCLPRFWLFGHSFQDGSIGSSQQRGGRSLPGKGILFFFFLDTSSPFFFFVLILSFHSRLVNGSTDFCCC